MQVGANRDFKLGFLKRSLEIFSHYCGMRADIQILDDLRGELSRESDQVRFEVMFLIALKPSETITPEMIEAGEIEFFQTKPEPAKNTTKNKGPKRASRR